MKQQTAVEFYREELSALVSLRESKYKTEQEIFKQANEMFEQQIKDAWNNGYREFYDGSSTPEEYYKKTFKSE
jgi:translation initiation factor 2B subunit (eIF-2B alpha/beta/delta family)